MRLLVAVIMSGRRRRTKNVMITKKPFLIGALAGLSLLVHPFLRAQGTETARFALGTVPDQTIWSGSTRVLQLHWEEQTGVTMTMEADPAPTGRLTLDPFEGPDWVLSYAPDPADKKPFNLTVTASLDDQLFSQTWQMSPQSQLPPEADFFGTGQHTQPPTVSTAEVSVFDEIGPVPVALNYQTSQPHNIRIVGDTVVLEQGHENGLYEAYCDGVRRDLMSVEIIAERVVVRSPVHWKQSQVSIWARELLFEGDGQIKTTPHEKLTSKGSNGNGGIAGDDGLPAGNVALHVGDLSEDAPALRFDLTGGQGQPGGPGQHGSNGSSVSTRWSSVRFCDSGICKTHTPASGYTITYYYYTFAGATVKKEGTTQRPGDGTDAKPSGKPGEGGDGGSITSTVDLAGLHALSGGRTADPTLPASFPYDRYKGGSAGSPAKSEHVHFYLDWFTMKSSASRHTADPGDDAAVRRGNTVAGSNGGYALQERGFSWVHPLSLHKVLEQIRDDYLGNRIESAQTRLEDYVALLTAFRTDPEWEELDGTAQLEIGQIHDEMARLLQQIEAGFDYFGNPPGWVPMLSFEVNSTLFRNEIERAMRTLYLTYWLGNKAATEQQKLEALTTVRDELREQLAQARTDYDAAVARLPLLRTKASDLNSEIGTVQNDLEAEELRLLESTREPDWVFGLRFGLKLSAMMCQMVPVYQPALGTVGEGLRVASDFNPDRPWDSIKGAQNVASAYMDSGFEESADEQKTAKDGVDPDQAEENSFDYAGALVQAGQGLAAGVEDISGFLKEQEAPSEEMLAELERLKSRSPEYKALLERVEDLMERNRAFTEEAVLTMQQIARLSDFMRRSLLAIDALNRDIAPAATVLDDRASAYLEDLERRAFERLVKYHYYMAKAYEYRLLQPYTETLNLEGLLQKFQEIADLNSDHEMTPAQFESLMSVYEDSLSSVAESIFDHYNSNRPELSVPIRFNLLPGEIDTLNAGGAVTINLHEAGFFQPSEENVRIVDLRVFSIETQPEFGSYGRTAFLDLDIEHSGISNLKLDGAIHRFRHYNRLTENPIVWGGRYDPVDDQIDPIQPSAASDSLLRSLLSGDAVNDMLLYSRPAAWADLRITRDYFDNTGQAILINSVRLEMVFDFTPRRASLGQRNLEIMVNTMTEDPIMGPVVTESTFLPYFELGAEDVNGRRDARGRVLRVFESGPAPVSIAAPASYGSFQFAKWTDGFGRELPGGPYTDPVYLAPRDSDQTIAALYVPAPAGELRLDTPTLAGGTLMLNWAGESGVRLQQRVSLEAGEWQDVPGTDGQSQAEIPVSGGQSFFRLIR
jgi:hypothetical protein